MNSTIWQRWLFGTNGTNVPVSGLISPTSGGADRIQPPIILLTSNENKSTRYFGGLSSISISNLAHAYLHSRSANK
jgi:hypothetical protein